MKDFFTLVFLMLVGLILGAQVARLLKQQGVNLVSPG
jgi:hypothetical protein